jgi:hypothetical protein
MTIAGAWANLESMGDSIGALNDTATGKIAFGGALPQTWSPTLLFGGGVTGITYSVRVGTYQRTADGGYQAYFDIVLTSKGSSSGAATISGIPYQCDTASSSSLSYVVAMTGLTGAASINLPGGTPSPSLDLYQWSATGVASLNETQFTNTTTLVGEVRCAKTH